MKIQECSSYSVYIHTTPSGKRYVGITAREPEKRWGHGTGYKHNEHFWNAIQKYTWEEITHDIIMSGLSKEDACAMERTLIERYNTHDPRYGYNLTKGGEHFEFSKEVIEKLKGPKSLSQETREQMRARGREAYKKFLKGREITPEQIQKMRETKRGRKMSQAEREAHSKGMKSHWDAVGGFTDEHRAKLSAALKGRTYSEETLARMKAAHAPEKNARSRAVKQMLNGQTLNIYCSAREAMRQTGINYTSIVRACGGVRLKSAGGYEWQYV